VSAPLGVGLDVRPALLVRTGIGRVARELAAALARQPGLRVVPFAAMAHRPRAELRLPGVSAPPVPARLQRALAPLGFSVETLLGPLDVFQHTDLVFAPVAHAAPVVIVHDLCFLRGAGWHDAGFVRRVEPRLRAAAARARALVVPSARVAADVASAGLAPPDRVHVVPWGADHVDRAPAAGDAERLAALRRRAGLPADGPLVLLPGTREPRKNQLAALDAFLRARSAARGAPAVLLLAGPRGWGCTELEARLADPALAGAVSVAGEVDEADLAALLRGADVVLYPSFEEGFGLPVAEALRCGRAVLTSAGTPMADLGGEAVVAVDPRDAAALEQALARLLADPAAREALGAAGRRAVAPFTWDAAAARLAQLYRTLVTDVHSATA
jgi:glycosyltransferase involved in cell wall biosynthesis